MSYPAQHIKLGFGRKTYVQVGRYPSAVNSPWKQEFSMTTLPYQPTKLCKSKVTLRELYMDTWELIDESKVIRNIEIGYNQSPRINTQFTVIRVSQMGNNQVAGQSADLDMHIGVSKTRTIELGPKDWSIARSKGRPNVT